MITLRDLSELHSKKIHERCPSDQLHTIPKKSYSDKDANRLTESIVACFDYCGGWASRISSEGRYIESLGRRIPSNTKKGISDIHACFNGKHLSIEIKMPGDRISDDQLKVKQHIELAGGIYKIVSNWNEFAEFFESIQKEIIK